MTLAQQLAAAKAEEAKARENLRHEYYLALAVGRRNCDSIWEDARLKAAESPRRVWSFCFLTFLFVLGAVWALFRLL